MLKDDGTTHLFCRCLLYCVAGITQVCVWCAVTFVHIVMDIGDVHTINYGHEAMYNMPIANSSFATKARRHQYWNPLSLSSCGDQG